jgi:hypothetical protein
MILIDAKAFQYVLIDGKSFSYNGFGFVIIKIVFFLIHGFVKVKIILIFFKKLTVGLRMANAFHYIIKMIFNYSYI